MPAQKIQTAGSSFSKLKSKNVNLEPRLSKRECHAGGRAACDNYYRQNPIRDFSLLFIVNDTDDEPFLL